MLTELSSMGIRACRTFAMLNFIFGTLIKCDKLPQKISKGVKNVNIYGNSPYACGLPW
jgi:hypothetical protein